MNFFFENCCVIFKQFQSKIHSEYSSSVILSGVEGLDR